MKNFLIFLSIVVVTLLAATDLKQRMSELDSISEEAKVKTETVQQTQSDDILSKEDSDITYKKTHR